MTDKGQHTLAEITSQPEIWQDALRVYAEQAQKLRALWDAGRFEQVVLTGCGSTYYAALIGAALIQAQTGVPGRALSASELMLAPQVHFKPGMPTLLIMVSREGKTRETIEAARQFRAHGRGVTLAVTCTSESVLAEEADVVLAVDTAREISRAQTRSFSSMTLLLQALALTFAGRDAVALLAELPAHLARLLRRYEPLARELGAAPDIQQFMFLGSGALYGMACEAMLKAMETTLLPGMAFHVLESMHGPLYVTTDRTLVGIMVQDELYAEEIRALAEAQKRGARCLLVMDQPPASPVEESVSLIALETGLPIEARAILYLPLLQLLIYHQSVNRGLNPDRPGKRD
jgi:glucosamine--fructose-6-phosphate aminotransferase (isomerizing)